MQVTVSVVVTTSGVVFVVVVVLVDGSVLSVLDVVSVVSVVDSPTVSVSTVNSPVFDHEPLIALLLEVPDKMSSPLLVLMVMFILLPSNVPLTLPPPRH